MDEKNTVKDLMNQAANTKHLVDGVNKALYGMTFDELIRLKGEDNEKENPVRGTKAVSP